MKILKRGKVKNEYPKMTCAYCDTIFEYLKTDVSMDRDGRYVVCPVCGKFLSI